jgi:UDP-N-acetylmuramoyl-tripeptide--D-alanyl-D-alanine ligase
MLAAVLAQRFGNAVLKTAGNWNNHFGLPRMLLRLSPEHRLAVLEMGTNHPGEISTLTALARPDVAVVTNVGQAHLEHLGTLNGVAREKGCIFEGLPAGGLAVFDAGCAQAEILRKKTAGRRFLTFGHGPDADVRGTYLGRQRDGGLGVELFFRASATRRLFTWDFAGAHQALNAAAVSLVGAELGLSIDEIVAGLRSCVVPGMRMLRREVDGVVWINDAYNANPESMKASLSSLAEAIAVNPAAHVLVLGDMLELGTAGAAAHLDVLRFARRQFPGAIIIAVGPLMQEAAANCGEAAVGDAAAARPLLECEIKPGRTIFLKASRGMGLEALMPREP